MKAKELVALLEKSPELELGTVNIWNTFTADGMDEKRAQLARLVVTFGEFKKELVGSDIIVKNTKNPDLYVTVYGFDTCKFIGKRKVLKEVVVKRHEETEMREIEELVTDCDVKNGKVQLAEVLPMEEQKEIAVGV